MSKLDEFFNRQYDKAIQLSLENEEIIEKATHWCKNLHAQVRSSGLIADSFDISCQHSDQSFGGVNLPMIVPSFIIHSCTECLYHEPNGDASWGKQIIENHKHQLQEHETAEGLHQEQLKVIREKLQELPRQTKENADLTERQILTYIEQLFSEDEETQNTTAKLLVQAARIGSDLFPNIALDILVAQSLSDDFALYCLPICVKLAEQRKDCSLRFKEMALSAINDNIYPELAAEVLYSLGQFIEYPLESKIIENLIRYQRYCRLVGGWDGDPPSYPNTIKVLACCYEADSSSIIKPITLLLKENDKYVRINVFGLLNLLQKIHPKIGLDLLPNLIASLELDDDPFGESADVKAKKCIVKAFCYDPSTVDEYLISVMPKMRPSVQEEIISIYKFIVSKITKNENHSQHKMTEIQVENWTKRFINRYLEFLQADNLDINVRYKASECIKSLCDWNPEFMASYFEILLGYYALICPQSEPPSPPIKIILPGQIPESPQSEFFNKEDRNNKWNCLKSKLVESLESLIKYNPKNFGEIVIDCYERLDTKNNEKIKLGLLKLLANIGKEYSLQPQVLTLLMNGLMDFESQVIRAYAINSVTEIYRHSPSKPPKNIVDILILHLKDTFVIVHQAVIKAFSWHGNWLNQEQASEALNLMIGWLYIYQKRPYDLDDIAEAILNVANKFIHLKNVAINHIDAIFPTNEHLVDQSIIKNMIQCVEPNESLAIVVANQIAWFLANYDGDRYNGYRHSTRAEMFQWLYEMPHSIYQQTKIMLLECAKKLSQRDAWESCYFANLFAKHDDYLAEQEVLDIAANSLDGEKQYSEFRNALENIKIIAKSNVCLQNNDLEKSNLLLSQINDSEI